MLLVRHVRRAATFSCFAIGLLGSFGVRAQEPAPAGSAVNSGTLTAPVVVMPRAVVDPGVTYPEIARKERYFNAVTVILILEIDAKGVVKEASVLTPQGHGFDEEAKASARKIVFEPARRDGVPFAARIKFQYVFQPPKSRLVGRVAQRDSDAPIAGVNVQVKAADGTERTVQTGTDGRFRVDDLPGGKVQIAAVSTNYVSESTDEQIDPGEEAMIVLRLASIKAASSAADSGPTEPVAIDVDVRGEKPPREVTKRTLSKDEIAVIPGTNGDALRSIQSLPGVARPPPFGGQLIVRGSAPADTGVFVDKTPIPLVYHFGGLSSVVPTEILDKIDFYPGNYSSTFGRGMGGVVDVGLRNPKGDGIHAMAQVDLIDARLLAEAPLFDTGWKLLIAGRRSWFDAWLGPVLEATNAGVTTAPVYYDGQVMLQKDLTPRSSFRALFLASDDSLKLLIENPNASNPTFAGSGGLHTSFWRLQARYDHQLSDTTRLEVVAAGGQDSFEVGIGSNYVKTDEVPLTARAELSHRLFRGVQANFGVDLLFSPYEINVRFPAPTRPGFSASPLDTPLESKQSGSRLFAGAYTEWELTPRRGTRIVPGLRLDYSSSTDTWDVSPRINARHELANEFPRTTLKGGIGLFYQPPSAQQTDPVFGQEDLRSSQALQGDLGIEQQLHPNVELSMDLFYKQLNSLVVVGMGNLGEGFVVGAEWLLRYKPDGRFFGWLSYTLSRSERRNEPTDPFYVDQYDQTHILTAVGSYDLGRGYRLGGRFRVVSGGVYTPASQGAYDSTAGVYQQALASPPNGARLPLFHQLDFRFDKTWSFEKWKLTGYIDVQNVYNYQAAEGINYNYNYTQQSYTSGLTILPSIGLRGEL